MRASVTITASDPGEGFTLAELRAFLGQCDMLGVADDAYLRARQVKVWDARGGRLSRLTVDTPSPRRPVRRGGLGRRARSDHQREAAE